MIELPPPSFHDLLEKHRVQKAAVAEAPFRRAIAIQEREDRAREYASWINVGIPEVARNLLEEYDIARCHGDTERAAIFFGAIVAPAWRVPANILE